MPTLLAILLLVALFVGVCLGAGLIGRRLRNLARDDHRGRYRTLSLLLVASGLVMTLVIVTAIMVPRHAFFPTIVPPIIWVVLFGINFRKWWQAREQLLAQPVVSRTGKTTASFLWQAVFILLPVALMSGFGFWAIVHERNTVEPEARQRAQEILHSLPADFGRAFANQLTDMQMQGTSWYRYLESGLASWGGDKDRGLWVMDTNEMQLMAHHLQTLHQEFPKWQDGSVNLIQIYSDTNGDFAASPLAPPSPPDWVMALTPAQQQAWVAVQGAGDAESISNAVVNLRATHPPKPALAEADFFALRAGVAQVPATNAIARLLQFASRHGEVVSDGGLPLRTLALAAALGHARECGPSERLWLALRDEAVAPGWLTPNLLDQGERLVANNPELSLSVRSMRILYADKLAQAELAQSLRQSGKVNGVVTTNLWVNALGRRWFCILSPNERGLHTIVSNRPTETISYVTECDGFSEHAVGVAFEKALAGATVSLPDYFGLSLDVEGWAVPLARTGDKSGEVLAEEHFQMSEPALMRKNDLVTGQETETPFEAMPGHPQFTVRIQLADRSLLFARQSRLQWIFGTLIGASALAAMVGVLAAYRAFRREQMYGEMKSNFVSSVSHELRAPIASVRLMAENLERGKIPDAARQGEYFRFIVQECRRLSALIENVLDFSRIEQGRKQYEAEPTNLVALTDTTVRLMVPYASEKGVELTLEALPVAGNNGAFEMDVDGRAIQQALVNLIDNAVKHSPKGGTVAIALQKSVGAEGANAQSSCIRLSVSDYGPGIPAAEHEKIFERFYRLGSELRRETQGVGIGLSVVKHIVEAHGGRVLVESAPGRGSRFTIELPLRK